ncbi:transferase family III [Fusarium subglutinans]|uniref:Transferase family III n=1 Tax=Gibberella subglutinans TaxID=42677 RepID=A0A8H5KQT9_GIBSU|nr:transferase family III [Fusarium subglutinans]KAF5578819.1 transferase family III [Fusarium subglutinans]
MARLLFSGQRLRPSFLRSYICANPSSTPSATRAAINYRYNSSNAAPRSASSSQGALTGIKIIDLSRVLAGPFCTQILADYGAEVTKVEAVGKGDDTRHWIMAGEKASWNESSGPISNYFAAVNRNKRSITVNFKKAEGRQLILDLIKDADVVVENFKPGTMERLGLGYDVLKELNPRIIYAGLSGYGRTGPYRTRGGYDPIAAAEAGLLHVTGEKNGPPVRAGIGLVDMSTGLFLHGAILSALIARARDGTGQRVDASLFETQLSLLTNVGLAWLNLGIEAERWGCQHPSIAPYDAFKTRDRYLVCGATNDNQYAALCRLLGVEHLVTDPRFITNPLRVQHREELAALLGPIFASKTIDEWITLFEPSGLPFGPINNMEATFAHPQTAARDMVIDVPMDAACAGSIKVIGPAVKFGDSKTGLRTAPPRLGQHTVEILEEMGMDAEAIAKYKEDGII